MDLTTNLTHPYVTCSYMPSFGNFMKPSAPLIFTKVMVKCNYCKGQFNHEEYNCPGCGANDRIFNGITL